MRLDVLNRREFAAAGTAVRTLASTFRKQMTDADTERIIGPEWNKQLRSQAKTQAETQLLVNTSDIAMSEQGIKLQSASKGRPLSGGLTPQRGYGPVEHGSRLKQFRPRNAKGYVVGPAIRAMIPRITDVWMRAAERLLTNAFHGKG